MQIPTIFIHKNVRENVVYIMEAIFLKVKARLLGGRS